MQYRQEPSAPYRQPATPPPAPPRFMHADSGHMRADAAFAGVVATIPLAMTLDALSLFHLPRLDLAGRFAQTFAGDAPVGLGAGAMGWIACALLGVALALTYLQSLARVWPGAGAFSGALHGLTVWSGGVLWAWLWADDISQIDAGVACSLAIGLVVFGATMGALTKALIVRGTEGHEWDDYHREVIA